MQTWHACIIQGLCNRKRYPQIPAIPASGQTSCAVLVRKTFDQPLRSSTCWHRLCRFLACGRPRRLPETTAWRRPNMPASSDTLTSEQRAAFWALPTERIIVAAVARQRGKPTRWPTIRELKAIEFERDCRTVREPKRRDARLWKGRWHRHAKSNGSPHRSI
jgi:hypothetical protein